MLCRVSPVTKYEMDELANAGPPTLKSSMKKVAAAAKLGRSIQDTRQALAEAEKAKPVPFEPGKPGHHKLGPLPSIPLNDRRRQLMAMASDAVMFQSAAKGRDTKG